MSTQKSKLAAIDDDGHPASEQRLSLQTSASHEFPENEPESSGFSGTCENTSLSDWIQLVQMNRRDAVIGIKRHDGRKALLWCREGDIIDAWCDGIIGEEAVYQALGWDGGRVSVAFAPFERARRIDMTTSALLLRAAHRRDSGVRQRAVRVAPIAFVALDEPPPSSRNAMPPPPSTVPPPDSSRIPPSSPLPVIGPLRAGVGQPKSARPANAPTLASLPLVVSPPTGTETWSRPELSFSRPREGEGATPKASAPTEFSAKDTPMKDAPAKSDALRAPAANAVTAVLARIRERAWLAALALGLLPLLGLGVSWLVTARSEVAAVAPRKLTAHAEPLRPELVSPSAVTTGASADRSPIEVVAPQALEKPAQQPLREAPRVSPSRHATAPWPAKTVPTPSPAAPTKPVTRAKTNLPATEERAPRVQIIEERAAKIEVIE
ncbi:MAG TPA: DUF4388 domain-containing protein [Polyangiaceae bacterium]|nr:DUF4388 domain-containing protein [Polyangiaceae bacterium]